MNKKKVSICQTNPFDYEMSLGKDDPNEEYHGKKEEQVAEQDISVPKTINLTNCNI